MTLCNESGDGPLKLHIFQWVGKAFPFRRACCDTQRLPRRLPLIHRPAKPWRKVRKGTISHMPASEAGSLSPRNLT